MLIDKYITLGALAIIFITILFYTIVLTYYIKSITNKKEKKEEKNENVD